MAGHEEPLDLKDKAVTGDSAIQKVIEARAKVEELQREIKALRRDRDELLDEFTDLRNARRVNLPKRKKASQTREDKVRISCGDLHGMRMDKKAVSAFLADLKVLDPDEIVLGGDMVECGGWLAKHQPIGFVALTDYSYQEDIEATSLFLDKVQKVAPKAEIHYLEGQHEDRVERWVVDQTMAHRRDSEFLRKAFAPEFLLRLKERGIPYYRRSFIYVEGLPRGWIQLGKMFFTHELGTSKNAARDAVSKTAHNITYFHTHREDAATRVFPGIGIVKAFNPGCLCTMQPVWQNSNPTDWSQGYGVDIIARSGNFQRIHVPIWRGVSLAEAMVKRFGSE